MAHLVKVPGATAERFRAYARRPLTRKPNAKDYMAAGKAGRVIKPGTRIEYEGEDIAAQGAVVGDKLSLDAGAIVITKVVFYNGPVEAEAVAGSVEVNAAGHIEIELVEPDPDE
jgi:hypothetical protein